MKRQILSLTVAGVFLLFALASIEADNATHTDVPVTECEQQPDFVMNYKITGTVYGTFRDRPDSVLTNIEVKIFIAEQTIYDENGCLFNSLYYEYNLTSGPSGQFSSPSRHNIMANSGDLVRVEIKIEETANFSGWSEVVVFGYSVLQGEFIKNIRLKSKNIL